MASTAAHEDLDGTTDADSGRAEREPLYPSARSSARMGLGQVDVLAPGLIHCRLAGKIRLEHIGPLLDAGSRAIAEGCQVLLVIDADDVHGYESEVRRALQTWIKRNEHRVSCCWMLYRSPIVKMGISLANSFTGGLVKGFSDPEEFDEAVSEATRLAQRGLFSGRPQASAAMH